MVATTHSLTDETNSVNREAVIQLLKAMANEHRLSILCSLRDGEVAVSELSRTLPLSQSALSQHLAWLRGQKLVTTCRQAQCIYYRLCDDKVSRIIQLLNQLYCEPEHGDASA